jgi:hypothetical protein
MKVHKASRNEHEEMSNFFVILFIGMTFADSSLNNLNSFEQNLKIR